MGVGGGGGGPPYGGGFGSTEAMSAHEASAPLGRAQEEARAVGALGCSIWGYGEDKSSETDQPGKDIGGRGVETRRSRGGR